MTAAELLRAAKEKIGVPWTLCRGNWAQDAYGVAVSWADPKAVSWCADGALQRIRHDINAAIGKSPSTVAYMGAWIALTDAVPTSPHHGVIGYSDSASHEDVMAWFDRAIALAGG